MTWPIKITFRPNPDREITKEIKIDPHSPILAILFKSCELFDLEKSHNYAISFKKTILPLLDSVKEAKLVQGSTVLLMRSLKLQGNREIRFNYKVQCDSGPLKLIGHYRSEENFINCLQNAPSDSSKIDLLHHSTKLPTVTILSAKLTAQDLMRMSDFTLESLGLKGNYSVMINYADSYGIYSEFASFLMDRKVSEQIITENDALLKKENEMKTTIMPQPPTKFSTNIANIVVDVHEISYKVYRQSIVPVPAPDVPDSFFDLTKEELLMYQRGLQTISKSVNDRTFGSSKTKVNKDDSNSCGFVAIKLVFNEKINVQADFSLNWTVGSILDFVRIVIFESHESAIELWTGSPCKLLTDMQKTIRDCRIIGPTRIIVNCKKYAFRKNLDIIEN